MTPTEALDRIAALCDHWAHTGTVAIHDVRAILAEVTPEPGGVTEANGDITLTPEEAARAAGWYYGQADDIIVDDADRALVARLEASR